MSQISSEESIAAIYGNGAYDSKECHNAIAARGAIAIIPTRKNAQFRKENTAGTRARNALGISGAAWWKPKCTALNYWGPRDGDGL